MGEEIVEMLETVVRESVAFIVNGCSLVCAEILKFFLILLILYYFALWSFRALDQLALSTAIPEKFVTTNYFKTDYGFESEEIVSQSFLRIGAPDEKLIKQRADLLEQLEIEAEFEESIKQHPKSENKTSNHEIASIAMETANSAEIVPFKDFFISQKQYDSNETSQSSQTTKTSLGKKSIPKENTLIDRVESIDVGQDINVTFSTDSIQQMGHEPSTEHETSLSNTSRKG